MHCNIPQERGVVYSFSRYDSFFFDGLGVCLAQKRGFLEDFGAEAETFKLSVRVIAATGPQTAEGFGLLGTFFGIRTSGLGCRIWVQGLGDAGRLRQARSSNVSSTSRNR